MQTFLIIEVITMIQLIEAYAERIMDGMDMKTMEQFVFDTLVENLQNYSEEELIEEIRDTNPDLLED